MNNILSILLLSFGLLTAQTTNEIKQAKEVIKKPGMSESEVRAAAKVQGYSDKEIDAVINVLRKNKMYLILICHFL